MIGCRPRPSAPIEPGCCAAEVSHPDINLLGAFAEHALDGFQRRALIAHLADCRTCRSLLVQVGALHASGAAAAGEAQTLAFTLPAIRDRSPAWRWALPVSALTVAALLVWLPPRPVSDAGVAPPVAVVNRARPVFRQERRAQWRPAFAAPTAPAVNGTPGMPAAAVAPAARVAAVPGGLAAGAVPPPAPLSSGGPAATVAMMPPAPDAAGAAEAPAARLTSPAGFVPRNTGFDDQPPMDYAIATTAIASLNAGLLAGGPGAVPAPAVAVSALDLDDVPPLAAMPAARLVNDLAPSAAPMSAPGMATGFGAGIEYVRAAGDAAARVAVRTVHAVVLPAERAVAPAWQLSASGELLHAVGAGFWAVVPIAPPGAGPAGAAVQLSALAISDDQIWTGGMTSALFVSRDDGKTFSPVRLVGAQQHPARIVTIDFPDQQHGIITASDGRYWTTLDGGQHWAVTVP